MSLSTTFQSVWKAALLAGLLLSLPLMAQEFRGTITGTVVDPTGAAVPKAQIEVRNVDTVAVTTAQANDQGVYTVPFLIPGNYKLTATVQGFKQFVRDAIQLHAGDRVQVDVKLQVGASTESVLVTSQGEQLETATATMGQVIEAKQVRDLPIMGRNTFMVAAMATGVDTGLYGSTNVGQESAYGRPFDGAAAQMSFGGLGSAYQTYLNGIPDAPEERASAAIYTGFVPSPDAVEEVNVQTNLYDAQYGHTSGAVINTVLKGGTNTIHGEAYEFFRNDKLNASNIQSNLAGAARPVMRWNQPGFVVDGPVRLPKVYNGKDKTFFMVSWELIRNSNPTPVTYSVPTAAERTGNFTGLVQSNGQPILIYDPLTTTLTGGQYLRQPFPGNIVPTSRINAVGQAFMNYYPLPDVPGNAQGFNNYVDSPNSQADKYHSLAIRMDHQINAKNKITGTFVDNARHQFYPTAGFPEVASPGYIHYRNNQGGSLDWTDTLSPSTVLDVKYGLIYHPFQLQYYGDNFNLTQAGFSSAFANLVPHETFPGTSMSSGYSNLQNAASQWSTTVDHSLSGTINKIVGRHSIKFGAELFVMRANNITPISNVNAFAFSPGFTQQNASSSSAAAGNTLASMLLGYPSSGGYSVNIASAFQQIYYGAFIQDDWRVTDKLTVNLGLRWDYEGPLSERYNRQNRGFDFVDPNPLQSQVTGLTLPGGLLFTDSGNRLPFIRDLNNWGPRLGVSYHMFKNTVLRGGIGIVYEPTFQSGSANGFSNTTAFVASNDGNLTPSNQLVNPFPTGLIQPVGRTLGLSTLVGQGFTFADPNRTIPKVAQYSLSLQQQLPQQILLEVAFAGNYASELPVSKGINVVPRSYYVLPGGPPPPVANATLVGSVANPMAGLLPGSSLNSATIPYDDLLVPYPEFGGITEQYRPLGQSVYTSLQVSVSKRLTSGLQGRFSFTWDKIMQETGYLNNQDDWSNLARAQGSEPNILATLTLTYELPLFAHSKGALHGALGGWETNFIMRYVDGYLISAPGSSYSTGVDPKLTSGQSYNQWFNTCSLNTSGVRQDCASATQPVAFIQLQPFNLGTLSGVLPGVRSQVPVNVDFSLYKTFAIKERAHLQFRASAYNLGNTPQFGNPNTSFGSAAMGQITISQVNDPRIVELALKLNF